MPPQPTTDIESLLTRMQLGRSDARDCGALPVVDEDSVCGDSLVELLRGCVDAIVGECIDQRDRKWTDLAIPEGIWVTSLPRRP
jgi:hypothetical protein